ncbi:MAG: DNA polymerase III subunit alpha [Sporolactobacillus sp.]
MTFVHLHVYSEYSLLESTCRLPALVSRAKASGQPALAITDRNAMYGVVPFYKACLHAGIQPVIGMTLALKSGEQNRRPQSCDWLVLLAEDEGGYRNLVRLASKVQTERDKQLPYSELVNASDGLIVLSGGREGPVDRLLAAGRLDDARRLTDFFRQKFPGRFYLECQPGSRLEQLKQLDAPLVVTSPVHCLEASDVRAYACLRAIDRGTSLSAELEALVSENLFFLSADALAARTGAPDEAFASSVAIAARCHVTFDFNRRRLPAYPLAPGQTAKATLRALCMQSVSTRVQQNEGNVTERLEKELAVIDRMGFNDYFLIVADLVKQARRSNILAGPGRGSAAGSLVAYLLGITEVDPLRYHLLFERFLNPERVSMPDIDLDFPDEERETMIAYAREKYGRSHVAQIITFGTFGARAALRDAGRALGLSQPVVDRLARGVPQEPKMTLERALKASSQLRGMIQSQSELADLFALASQIEGLARHTSIHAAGVIFSDRPLTELVPLQEGHEHFLITQYPMDALEALGLLKIDFLGLRNLTFMSKVLRALQVQTGVRISPPDIPEGDEKTYALLGRGDTTGVFQLESAGIRHVLRQLQPSDFEDVVAVVALYRPGPARFIGDYIKRKHGEEPVRYPHPDLEPILRQTWGVLVYQEQIMQIAVNVAGYSLGKADSLRRAIAKKKRELLEAQQKDFLQGCLANGYGQAVARQLFDLIVRFADYGFNRSHAVAYSLIAYSLAYLKANYPSVFMACYLTSIAGNQQKLIEAIDECRRGQLQFLPPSINDSVAEFTSEKQNIRCGLAAIKNFGSAAVAELLDSRQRGGCFHSLYDFCRRVDLRKMNRKAIESLIFAGACDCLHADRAVLLATLERALEVGAEAGRQASGQTSLPFEDANVERYEDVPPLSAAERISYERSVLGVCFSEHPVSACCRSLPSGFISVAALGTLKMHQEASVAALMETVHVRESKHAASAASIIVSDQSGAATLSVDAGPFSQLEPLLKQGEIAVLRVRHTTGGVLQLLRARRLSDCIDGRRSVLFLRIDAAREHGDMLEKLRRSLAQQKGDHRVVLFYERTRRTVALDQGYSVALADSFLLELRELLGDSNVVIGQSSFFT